MLHPKNDRIDYGEQLIPPDGYELVRAIGTTYSLDLEALMVLPVALFYSQSLDGTAEQLRYDMLDGITKSADKISVYYQNGQLKVPQKYHFLMAYWEKGIEAVTMPNHVSSFHPKVWIIRYEKGKADRPIYRFLVTSRNLTFARDWDMAFSTDGKVTDTEQPANKPLVHFLEFLNATGKKKIAPEFIRDLLKVKFDLPAKFEKQKFHAIGITNPENGKKYPNPVTTKKDWDEMLIVSPFVDKTTLDTLAESTDDYPYLLSRKEEMDALAEETLQAFHTWEFAKYFQEAEFYEELAEDDVLPQSQNLHAKLFVATKDKVPYWFLGSANCTDPAQQRNVEFMVELKGANTAGARTKDVFKAFTNPDKENGVPLFTKYDFNQRVSVEEQKQIELDVRAIKYQLAALPISGNANKIEGGTAYDLEIIIDATKFEIPKGYKVKIKPLPEEQRATAILISKTENRFTEFTGYAETALSPYLVFEIWKDKDRVSHFLLPMEIILPDSRLNKIFTSIINSREKFLKYLAFLLTGEETGVVGKLDGNKGEKGTGGEDGAWSFAGTPVYEKLLIAASRYPEKLKSIDALIQRLKSEASEGNEAIVTPEFERFWSVFQTLIENKK